MPPAPHFYGNLEKDDKCYCIEAEVVSSVLYARPNQITCPVPD